MPERTCSIEGCTKRAKCRGWCGAHHERWRKYGDPLGSKPRQHHTHPAASIRPPWPKPGECVEWQGRRDENGYGNLGSGGYISRRVFIALTGTTPEVVRHTCDNPACYRFEHLLGGTHADNVADRVARGRSATGHRNRGGRRTPLRLASWDFDGMFWAPVGSDLPQQAQ